MDRKKFLKIINKSKKLIAIKADWGVCDALTFYCDFLGASVKIRKDFMFFKEEMQPNLSDSAYWLKDWEVCPESNIMYRYLVLELYEQKALEEKLYLKY